MKKIFSLFLIAGLFALLSCGGSENKNQDSQDSAAAAAKADSMLRMSADTTQKMTSDSSKMVTDTSKKK